MAWKLRRILKGAPKGSGADVVAARLEEYEQRMRDALDEPMDDKRNNELTWPTFRLHYERNRYLYDQFRDDKISHKLIDYLVKKEPGKYDRNLIARWKKPGYERLCSLAAITKSNTNFGTTSVCRTPLKHRTGQITPSAMTGCVSCASGDGGPIWWNDPVPDIVKKRIIAIDPGKAALLKNDNTGNNDDNDVSNETMQQNDAAESDDDDDSGDEENEEILKRARALKASTRDTEDAEIMNRARALKESIPITRQGDDEAAQKIILERPQALKKSNEEQDHDAEIMKRARALKESISIPQQEEDEAAENLILQRAQALKESNVSKEDEEHDAEIMRRARALRGGAPTNFREEVGEGKGEGTSASPVPEDKESQVQFQPAEEGPTLGKRVHADNITGVEENGVRKRPRADGKET